MPDAPKNDDFDAAFAQFAAPEDKPADAAAAGAEEKKTEAAVGGDNDQGADGGDAGGSDGADAGGDAGGAGADAGAADGAGEKAGEEADKAGAEDGGAGEGGAGDSGDAADADKDKGDAGVAATEAGPSPDDILAGLKKLVGDVGAQAAEGGDQKPSAAKEEEPKPIYSADEEAFLKDYDKDWETVVKGEALKRRAEYQQLLEYIFTQVADFVKPIHDTAEAIADRTFRTELKTSVPDYSNDLRESVVNWVKTQPTYLQVAYNHVITEGSVDEVKDLIDRYRSSTGQAKPNGSGATKKTGKENELSDEAKKAAAQLAPVDSKRSGVQAPSDPSDFDDAWKLAAKELG